jgi:hypothetical protein
MIIHLLPTDKKSRLYKDDNYVLNLHTHSVWKGIFTNGIGSNQQIYITNDEEIKEGDYVFNLKSRYVYQTNQIWEIVYYERKIILTTDEQLIYYGVQAIDEEFLQWFVQNANESGVPFDRCEVESFCKNGDSCPSQ